MAKDDNVENLTELFFGNPRKYEHIRVDRSFYDMFKPRVIAHERVRKELQKRTGQPHYGTWKELSKALAEKQLKEKFL